MVMTERDELAFSRALRESFPMVMFAEDDHRSRYSDRPVRASIAHAKTARVRVVIPSPGQEQRMKINLEMDCVMVRPECHFPYDRSHWEYPRDPSKKWAFDPPILGEGQFVATFPRDDPVNKKFAYRVMRMLNKVTRPYSKDRGVYVAGHDAYRWCREGGPRRALGHGFRTPPDWVFPDLPYYNDDLWDDDMPPEPTLPSCGFGV